MHKNIASRAISKCTKMQKIGLPRIKLDFFLRYFWYIFYLGNVRSTNYPCSFFFAKITFVMNYLQSTHLRRIAVEKKLPNFLTTDRSNLQRIKSVLVPRSTANQLVLLILRSACHTDTVLDEPMAKCLW